MTNKEWLATLPDDKAGETILWLVFDHSRWFIDSRLAVIQWLGEEHKESVAFRNVIDK